MHYTRVYYWVSSWWANRIGLASLTNMVYCNFTQMARRARQNDVTGRIRPAGRRLPDGDLVIISLSAKGIQKLLNICSEYGEEHYIMFNHKERNVCIFQSKVALLLMYPRFS